MIHTVLWIRLHFCVRAALTTPVVSFEKGNWPKSKAKLTVIVVYHD